jgi:hypothetical protein
MEDDTASGPWFPSDWYNNAKHVGNSQTFSIHCFQLPDYDNFPQERLNDEDLFSRLILTMRDLQHARSALTFIQQEVEWETEYPLAELRRFQSYETSLVVSYTRPFSTGTSHLKALSFGALGIKLPQFTRTIHDDLLMKRNKVFAHSDPDAIDYSALTVMQMERHSGSSFTFLMPPYFREGLLFGEVDIARIEVLVCDLSQAVFDLAQEMHPNFTEKYRVFVSGDGFAKTQKD